ncbi:MAG: glycosyltransferase [Candidatus Kapaibacterium sp.]
MVYILIAAILIYVGRAAVMFFGSVKERRNAPKGSPENRPFVSVIIPARNEEEKIEDCIRSFDMVNYPKDKFEIIAVNDRSTDATGDILDRLQKERPHLKVVHKTKGSDHKNLQGKPGALKEGIDSSRGGYLLMTDADCVVHPEWINSVCDAFTADESTGLVAAYTLIRGNKSTFDKFQETEWIYMHTMAAAGFALGQPLGCFGNNLSIKREAYDKTGGYENVDFSLTEDLAMLRAVHGKGYRVRYLCSPESTVTTYPVKNFAEYMSQHRRWAAGGLSLGWRAGLFVLTSIAIYTALILAFLKGSLFWIFAVLFVRVAGDYAVINPALMELKKFSLRKWIIPSVFFYMFIELILPFTMVNKKIKWKGQKFQG